MTNHSPLSALLNYLLTYYAAAMRPSAKLLCLVVRLLCALRRADVDDFREPDRASRSKFRNNGPIVSPPSLVVAPLCRDKTVV